MKSAAATFFKLGGQLAGRSASRAERDKLLREFYERIVRDPATGGERTRDEKAGELRRTLAEMREQSFVAQASPTARRAHAEIDSFVPATDDLRASFTVPDGSSRAEHASFLNDTNNEARDLFERGATLYGETLIIPREVSSSPDRGEQIRLGTLAHAVREFESLIGTDEAKEKAVEFVQLGREIAGSTADGDTRLVVFRTFYQEIKRDENGKFRTREEQSAQLENVLERMRELASAMRAEEWQRAPVEIISLDDWERGLEERQRDAEIEAHGRLTYRLEETLELETDDERAAQERDRTLEQSADQNFVGGASAGVEYERVRLDELPPRVPEGLTQDTEERLRYEVIPHLDRQLETGARPADILRGVVIQAEADERRSRETEIAHILTTRAPAANREHPLNRAEEAVALYTLRALRGFNPASDPALDEEFARRAFLPHERAVAIDTVGARPAQDYRGQNARLNAFASLGRERERLQAEAARFREQVRATPEFQNLLEALRAQERDHDLSEHEALVRGNSARISTPEREQPGSDSARSAPTPQIAVTNYPELVGESHPPSDYAALREQNERANHDLRQQLTSLLVNPEIEQALAENARRVEVSAQHFRGLTGRDIGSADEARAALAPELRWIRSTLDLLAEERAEINIGRTRPVGEKQTNPLYVGLPEHRNHRLAVENINEYRTLVSVAEGLETRVLSFTSLRGREITGASEARELVLNFARDYVAYRQLDDTTRKLNEHRLFREYNARLSGAASASELLATIKEIRQDNYARAQHPERYRDERDAARRQGEQARRPLTEREMQQLFLDLTPAHFTEEMRRVLLNHSGTARDKAERIKGLETGALAPSASLRLLLAEFARTRSEDLARFGRNIRAFLADYLNPPTTNRLRFSAYNLYGLREKLSPAERDYFFKVVDDTRRSVTPGGAERQYDSRQARRTVAEERAGYPARDSSPRGNHQRNPVESLREHLEERVSNYLLSVVRERGVRSLGGDGESLDHAAQVARIIRDTITGRGHDLEDLSLDDDRVAAVSGKLVGEVAYALASRSRDHAHDFSLDQPEGRARVQSTREQLIGGRQPQAPEYERVIDDEVVEQKVSHVIGQITGQVFNRHSSGLAGSDGHHGKQHTDARDVTAGRGQAARPHIFIR
ncbi:MAG: hypothetical protein ACJ741_18255 [Pyrinomonadaceae bacterium]